MLDIKSPIALINGLSERTINALNKNKIFFICDLYPYKDNFSLLLNLPGVGKLAIKELDSAFKNLSGYKDKSISFLFNNFNINDKDNINIELNPFFTYNGCDYYLGSLCYLIFSNHRLRNTLREYKFTFYDLIGIKDFDKIENVGKSGIKDILTAKYKILEFYGIDESKKLISLYENYSTGIAIYEQIIELNLCTYILNYYNCLPEIDKNIILNRENWFRDSSHNRLHELGNDHNITRERIRQIESIINEDFDYYLKYHSYFFENYIIKLLKLNKDFETIKSSNIKEFSQFSNKFLANVMPKIISSNYLFHVHDLSDNYFFIKKSVFGDTNDFLIFDNIDNFFHKERKTEESITLNELTELSLGIKKKTDEYKYTSKKLLILKNKIEKYSPLIEKYLEYEFQLEPDKNGNITFPVNKKSYPTLIINELILCNKPIHYSDLYKILKEKYPQYSRKKGTVHSVLVLDSNAMNVGPGLYIHKSKSPKSQGFESIADIIDRYLNNLDIKCATLEEIVKFVRKQKNVSKKSICANLSENNRFIRISEGMYGLTSDRGGKVAIEKPESIIDIIEEFLELSENKSDTLDNIINYVKNKRDASKNSIIKLLWDKKRNKNKFIRIGTGTFGLTEYRGLNTISEKPNSIVSIIENYLENIPNKYATLTDIIKYVKNQRNASEKSIKAYLYIKNKNKNKFIRIGEGVFGLTKYGNKKIIETGTNGEDESKGFGNISNIIKLFLESKEDKYATVEDIIEFVKSKKKVSEKSIQDFLRKKSKNKNIITNIGLRTYGLTEYRKGKPKIQVSYTGTKPGSILDIIEKFLDDKKNKCATANDIIEYVKSQITTSDGTIKQNLWNKKINKNKIIFIGNGTYGLAKYWEGKQKLKGSSSITDLIEDYLEKTNNKYATISDIIKYVKSQKKASERSIFVYLTEKKRNKNKFINIGHGIYGLTKYREGKSIDLQKEESINDIIEYYLNNKKDKCATASDIIEYVKNTKNVSELSVMMNLKVKKNNNNKFVHIGKGIYGLTSYRSRNP